MDHNNVPKGQEGNKFIVKVQRSIVTSHAIAQVLVYNQERDILAEFDIDDDLEEFLDGDLKVFAYASLAPMPEGKFQLYLHGRAPWQDW